MSRKLFCEISPLTYRLSQLKGIVLRNVKDLFSGNKFVKTKSEEVLPVCIYKHASLIRRQLGNVDMQLQENKAVNLALTAPKLNKIIIRPGETFSFWRLAGNCTKKKGYKTGLTISMGKPSQGIGGGLCQFTNLIHWMVLHTDLTIVEHHHHDKIDLFPDFNRTIPFGTGTSIFYNYMDYRVKNNTDITYQLICYTTDEYLCGEIRADKRQTNKYHITARDEFFTKETNGIYRNGKVYRITIDKRTGDTKDETLIRTNHAKINYSAENLTLVDCT